MGDLIRVEVDDTAARRALDQFASALPPLVDRVGMRQAADTASEIRRNVPVRSGRLAATVGPVRSDNGGAVTYGGLPYAHYIEGRSHAVAHALDGADTQFWRALETATETEARRV
jgi:hypothetical protein